MQEGKETFVEQSTRVYVEYQGIRGWLQVVNVPCKWCMCMNVYAMRLYLASPSPR